MSDRIVLAYSGGLDTSVCIGWLAEETGQEVVAVAVTREPNTIHSGSVCTGIGLSRAAVWARIEELRALGYDIEAGPHSGYRLVQAPDVLHADDLLSRLGQTKYIGRDIRVFQETTSTNDVIDKLARDGVPEGVVVFAESQIRGRGRLGRKWVSPAHKGLWFSLALLMCRLFRSSLSSSTQT